MQPEGGGLIHACRPADAEILGGGKGDMLEQSFGFTLLAAALFAAGLAGIAAFWAAWPETSNTSPLAALVALIWSSTYIVSALLTWRRSRLAAPTFLAAMGLLLPLFWFLFLGDLVLVLPLFVFTFVLALLGYRYLRRAGEPVA
jgi:hypothetical protein